MFDIIIIGAGPAGLSVAREASEKGFKIAVIELGCIAYSLTKFPKNMKFFSSAAQLALRGHIFTSAESNPGRNETIRYYQKIARLMNVTYYLWHEAYEILGSNNAFVVKCKNRNSMDVQLRAKKIVIATGSFHIPRILHVPGENLHKVSHYYKEPYLYEGMKVLVVGGGDSAAEAALELSANNVQVILSYRKEQFFRMKPWTYTRIQRAITEGDIQFLGGSLLKEIREDNVTIWVKEKGEQVFENDVVLLLTGYIPNIEFLKKAGINVNESDGKAAYFQETYEANIDGIYLAGIIQAGVELERILIENSRGHGEVIVADILSKM